MKLTLYTADSRGHQQHGWLDAHHTFSFANYYDPKRIHFGVLRVLNDDIIGEGQGFGTHPHDNMEIITIPLSGAVEHRDSMGNHGIINTGDIQVMSAGSGINHSEFNANKDKALNLFQIWIFPNKQNVTPRYQQMSLDLWDEKNKLIQIVSPDRDENNSLWIHQDAWFNIGTLEKGMSLKYSIKKPGNGVFAMIIEGLVEIAGQRLDKRDGLGISETNEFDITAISDEARILLMDIPMSL